jgi:hypothetical protein
LSRDDIQDVLFIWEPLEAWVGLHVSVETNLGGVTALTVAIPR